MNRFLLKSDISRFFPSIYTHSIPWAIMGKANAKANLSSRGFDNSWENITDVLSRSLNNNQTIGIPIGPDTSLLLAEVILSCIDTDLASRFNELQGMRFIDDYEFYFATRSEAEATLSYLQHLLNEFELALNPHKTAIIELPDKLDTTWTSKIRCFSFRYDKGTGQKNDITAYFDMVFNFFKLYPEEALIKYAIGRLRGEEIDRDNWEFFEQILSHCVLIEPACIPQVCFQITYYQSHNYTINKHLWCKCLNRIVSERTPLGQSSEAAWAMWLMKVLKIGLEQKCAETAANSDDSIVGLMALGLADQGLACKKDLTGLNRFGNISGYFERQWLLCYQGNLMGWLGERADFSSDAFFSYLKSRDVSFFNIMIDPLPATKCIYSGGGGDGY